MVLHSVKLQKICNYFLVNCKDLRDFANGYSEIYLCNIKAFWFQLFPYFVKTKYIYVIPVVTVEFLL